MTSQEGGLSADEVESGKVAEYGPSCALRPVSAHWGLASRVASIRRRITQDGNRNEESILILEITRVRDVLASS